VRAEEKKTRGPQGRVFFIGLSVLRAAHFRKIAKICPALGSLLA
jgi:hypothetical protein